MSAGLGDGVADAVLGDEAVADGGDAVAVCGVALGELVESLGPSTPEQQPGTPQPGPEITDHITGHVIEGRCGTGRVRRPELWW